MLVRPIVVERDLRALQAMWRETWRDTYGPVLGPGRLYLVDDAVAVPDVMDMFAADGGGFVGLVEDAIAGSVCFAERHGIGYVWGMYVHPAHQRRGLGTALLARAACAMRGADRLELSTPTPAAAAFYSHLGFAENGTSEFELFPGIVLASTRFAVAADVLRDGPSWSGVSPTA